MDKIYAYIDEYGAYGFDYDKDNVSTHFIITAAIVNEREKEYVITSIDEIRKRYFQKGEIKSSSIGKNHSRRKIILSKILELPIRYIILVVDKEMIFENGGLKKSKSVFYKFLNEHLYSTLRNSYSKIEICADELGKNDFIDSFISYVKRKAKATQLSLFDESHFHLANSKQDVLIQVADLISGSVAYDFDRKKMLLAEGNNYVDFINHKVNMIKHFPRNFEDMLEDTKTLKSGVYDPQIMEICYRKAMSVLSELENKSDDNCKMQYLVLNYLLFRFKSNSTRSYISTKELKNFLLDNGFVIKTDQTFRNKIIGHLRDKGVILASSSKGYRIPKGRGDIENYINHDKSVILPMIFRLKICYDEVLSGSNGEIDLLNEEKNKHFRNILQAPSK